jgi:DNA-binding HxlR family transcriptional regulator
VSANRSYGEACPIAHSLDIVGDRWALLVVRELRLGPKRFTDLQASLPNAGPNVLAQRLRELEASGVLRRRTLPPPAGSRVYELTEWGYELEPVFRALARWGIRSPVVRREGRVSSDSVMLGVRTFFDPASGPPWTATYEVRLGGDGYVLRVVDGALAELVRGDAGGRADATVAGDRMAVGAVLDGADPLAEAMAAGRVTVTGDAAALDRLLLAVGGHARR